ncbi:hypothetical protein CC86DRAFT_253214, partial [Ophiobolus disseminans]
GFGPDAPPKDLPYPANANITAYELLAFLPHSLQCADVVYRLISNGGTRHVLWVLVNVARDMPKTWNANRCGTIMYKAMKDAGFENWTVGVHQKWHQSRMAEWDETILNVTGFRSPSHFQGSEFKDHDIPFRSLAAGVRRMPQQDDALDLTRMVEHCVQNPEEEWMYPRDYEKLCKALGEPAQVRIEHTDRRAFKRWEETIPPPPRIWSEEEKQATARAMETQTRRRRTDIGRVWTPASGRQSRDATLIADVQRKTRRGTRKRATLEEIDFDQEEEIPVAEEKEETTQAEQYKRGPAEYLAPSREARAQPMTAIALAFAAEHDTGEINPFSAYAFGGPRHRPPYRMLHEIQLPDTADTSGWAENLRWAWEQRACFWHAVQTEGWNESPEHMEQIAQTRQKQVWASDELLEQLAE